MSDTTPQLIGQRLLKRGFRDWFLYMFKVCENRPFVVEPIHQDLFDIFDDIYAQRAIRQVINLPPRSAKTTLSKYFIVYTMTIDPRCNWIYTSYSQSLLNTISSEIAQIFENPIYKAMYPNQQYLETSEEVRAVDDFWSEYIKRETGKNTYTSKKIITYAGGMILFTSAGGQILGFGAGIRNAKGFSGGVWLDDFDKVSDTTRSEVMRQKTHEFFSQTLLSRLNTPNAVVGCVQQRVNKDDISGYLIDTYGFSVLKKPLLDENGVCQIPSQYTPERIRELQLDDYAWQSQYMQEPIAQANQVFHPDWWRFYDTNDNVPYRRIFITADTANKTREWNDFTAIGVWGVTVQNRLRLLDVIHAKMEIPELQNTFVALWEKWQPGIGTCRCSAIYIEDKASGTQVIQQLRRVGGLPIMPYAPEKDKLSRALDAVPQVAAGNVELPDSPQHPITKEFLRELNNFTADGSALHDDQVDMMTMAVSEAFNQRGYF